MADPSRLHLPIRAVERETGLSKDVLRAWERRYGFPQPVRGQTGERSYPAEQVAKLRLMRRLVDGGRRPGQIVGLAHDELERLVQDTVPAAPATSSGGTAVPGEERCMALLKRHDTVALGHLLADACVRVGLERFITDLVAPLTTCVGDAWMRGQLAIFEEHLFSETLQVVLRGATSRLPEPTADARPRVLLTTFVDEPHGLGLLMAQALLGLDGAHCTSLGTGTPVWDIAQAARALRSDVVALSFTGAMSPTAMLDGLQDLRRHLPAGVEVWAGGSAPALHRRTVDGVTAMASLSQLHAQVARWRAVAIT